MYALTTLLKHMSQSSFNVVYNSLLLNCKQCNCNWQNLLEHISSVGPRERQSCYWLLM